MVDAFLQQSILHEHCRRFGLDIRRELAGIRQRQREDSIRCRMLNLPSADPAQEMLTEVRRFRSDLNFLAEMLADSWKGGRR